MAYLASAAVVVRDPDGCVAFTHWLGKDGSGNRSSQGDAVSSVPLSTPGLLCLLWEATLTLTPFPYLALLLSCLPGSQHGGKHSFEDPLCFTTLCTMICGAGG